MWREITRIEKPIVASMSDVAASGGYYISMGCDKIYAEPGTLTGSIGVISVKLAVGGLLEKVGVTTDTVTVGKNGTFNSVDRPLDRLRARRDAAALRGGLPPVRRQGREGPQDDLRPARKEGRRRVYTGRQAKAEGLVDEIGTLADAIASAKDARRSWNRARRPNCSSCPARRASLSRCSPRSRSATATPRRRPCSAALPEPLRGPLSRLGRLTSLLASEPAVLIAPFELKVRLNARPGLTARRAGGFG